MPATVIEALLRPQLADPVLSVIVTAGLVPTLLWRRSRPLLMIVITFGVGTVFSIIVGREFPEQYVLVFFILMPYALFRWGSGREALLGAVIMLGKVGISAAVGLVPLGDALGAAVVLILVMTIGTAVRYRAKAKTRELDRVRLLERERLARDLHDTVAHHVSAMAVRAQAGIAQAPSNPQAPIEALRVIETEAARTLDEMRGMVGILRTDQPADRTPNPRIADLERLASDAGPAVDLEISGDTDSLPPPVSAAVYRLAQEAITNARRHARNATRIEVRIVADDDSVHLRVSDDGDPGQRPEAGSPGYGLAGMIERASLLGGTCSAGPDTSRGWTVTAMVPRTGAST